MGSLRNLRHRWWSTAFSSTGEPSFPFYHILMTFHLLSGCPLSVSHSFCRRSENELFRIETPSQNFIILPELLSTPRTKSRSLPWGFSCSESWLLLPSRASLPLYLCFYHLTLECVRCYLNATKSLLLSSSGWPFLPPILDLIKSS